MTDSQPGASPSSARYFYQSNLEAALMSVRYGMNFTDKHGRPLLWWGKMSKWLYADNHVVEYVGEQFYIHPDSLHLLEPQQGDLIGETHKNCRAFGVYNGTDIVFSNSAVGDGIALTDILHWQIIQRDGKAFHWPETEPVTAPADAAPSA